MSTSIKEAYEKAKAIDLKLKADDPRLKKNVYIIHEEGTTLFYKYAFIKKWKNWIMIFTEHHGYHVYDKNDLYLYQELTTILCPSLPS